ncbi:uncharacterized protein LOC134230500 isoform X2 [Saccostrea cucullata]|uniref:uncharacterized protein LOC134230500 isoform X2 n=1 Tax=Saccostrea cuccullata TaxID=36930 RepID=UPI002ED2640E
MGCNAGKVQAKPSNGLILKEGELLYCETQGDDWKSYLFELYENSTFVWSNNERPTKQDGSVKLKSVVDQICVGKDCEGVPDCPKPPVGRTVNYMISFPHNYPPGTRPTDMKNNWIVFRDDREMREWIAALEDVLNVKPLGVQSKSKPKPKKKKAPPQGVMHASQLAPLEIEPDPQEGLPKDPEKKDDTKEEEIQHTDFDLLLAEGQAMSRYSEDNMPHFGQA